MLWGSDRYSNPVQMVLEGWLLSIISFGWLAIMCLTDYHDHLWACFEKDKTQASMIIGHWEYQMLKKKFWIAFENLTMLCLYIYAL